MSIGAEEIHSVKC